MHITSREIVFRYGNGFRCIRNFRYGNGFILDRLNFRYSNDFLDWLIFRYSNGRKIKIFRKFNRQFIALEARIVNKLH